MPYFSSPSTPHAMNRDVWIDNPCRECARFQRSKYFKVDIYRFHRMYACSGINVSYDSAVGLLNKKMLIKTTDRIVNCFIDSST